MMVSVCYWVLNMSILGSLLGLILLLLRRIKKLPRLLIYLLWSLVFLRLVCPLGIISGYSFLNLFPKGSVRIVPVTGALDTEHGSLSYLNILQDAKGYQPITIKSDNLLKFYQTGFYIWITGAVLTIVSTLVLYYASRRELNKIEHIKDHVYECEHVSMPMVYGIFRQKIILPANAMKEENVRYLIAHENTHRKRHDNLWRFLSIMVACLHWFNPLIWVCVKRFCEDMELACDEGTIRKMEEEERKQYAYTLLSYAKRDAKLLTVSFGGSRVKSRIEHVVTYKNLTVLSLLGFSGMFLILCILLLSNQ